jgi:zinc transport system substrate-binding protein
MRAIHRKHGDRAGHSFVSSAKLAQGIQIFIITLGLFTLAFTNLSFADDTIAVAVSILPQVEFVKQVAGNINTDILVMIPPGASPATYEPAPDQMKKLSKVKIYFKVGTRLPFEQVWLSKIIDVNPGMLVIDCSKDIELLSGVEETGSHNGNDTYVYGQDPHIWCSPHNVILMIDNMVEGLIAFDPENEKTFRKNAELYKQQLVVLSSEIKNLFKSKTNRKFIIFHPAWGYFARDFDLTQVPIEIEGKEPGAGDLKKLIQIAGEESLKVVFATPQFNLETAEVIASAIDGKVEFIDPLRQDYLSNLSEVAIKLARAMN